MKVLVMQKFTPLNPHLKLLIIFVYFFIALIFRFFCTTLGPKLIEKVSGFVAEEFDFVVESQARVKVAKLLGACLLS